MELTKLTTFPYTISIPNFADSANWYECPIVIHRDIENIDVYYLLRAKSYYDEEQRKCIKVQLMDNDYTDIANEEWMGPIADVNNFSGDNKSRVSIPDHHLILSVESLDHMDQATIVTPNNYQMMIGTFTVGGEY